MRAAAARNSKHVSAANLPSKHQAWAARQKGARQLQGSIGLSSTRRSSSSLASSTHIPLLSDVILRRCGGGDFVTQGGSRYALDGTARSVRIWRWMSVSSGSKRRVSSGLWGRAEGVGWLERG